MKKEGTKKKKFFEIYISKVLKHISPESGLTFAAKKQLSSCVCIIAKILSHKVEELTRIAKKKTSSEKEVQNAVKIVFAGSLAINALSEGAKALAKYNEEDIKHSSRQDKAGILFPPSVSEKFLRKFGVNKMMITKQAPVYLASVLEYLIADILELSSTRTKDENRVRITIKDLELSVQTDEELSRLFNFHNIYFMGGGSIPSPMVSKEVKSKKDSLLLSRLPFSRIVRSILLNYSGNLKIGKNYIIVLQYYMEKYITDLISDANNLSLHSGRQKLTASDILFICKLRKITKPEGSIPDSFTSTESDDSVQIESSDSEAI